MSLSWSEWGKMLYKLELESRGSNKIIQDGTLDHTQ